MSNTPEKPDQETPAPATEPQSQTAAAQQAAGAGQPQRVQVELDDSRANTAYANFCRVTGTPEELIVDFGLNPQPFGVPGHAIPVTQRIIVNYYTAKRMLHALSMTVQRHEQMFGVLETDVQRRVRPGAMPQQQQQQRPAE